MWIPLVDYEERTMQMTSDQQLGLITITPYVTTTKTSWDVYWYNSLNVFKHMHIFVNWYLKHLLYFTGLLTCYRWILTLILIALLPLTLFLKWEKPTTLRTQTKCCTQQCRSNVDRTGSMCRSKPFPVHFHSKTFWFLNSVRLQVRRQKKFGWLEKHCLKVIKFLYKIFFFTCNDKEGTLVLFTYYQKYVIKYRNTVASKRQSKSSYKTICYKAGIH